VDREQRVRKFTLDNESPRSRTAIILPSTEKSERNSAPRRKPAGKYKINKCEKSPMPGRHGAKFGRDEASMIDTTSSPWKKSSDYGVQWPNLITMVWRIKM